jgi:uncharacterized protein with GYD domain
MPKYLLAASYSVDGAKGLLKDGGSRRRAAAKALVESLGGTLECFYFAFGETDAVAVVDMPDGASAAAASLAISAGGGATGRVTVLLTPEEIDESVKKSARYAPPGR